MHLIKLPGKYWVGISKNDIKGSKLLSRTVQKQKCHIEEKFRGPEQKMKII